jgi:hypothetical protein
MSFKSILLGVFSVVLILPQAVEAKTVVRTGDTVSVAQEQKIEGNFYTAAGIVDISGEMTADALVRQQETSLWWVDTLISTVLSPEMFELLPEM